MKKLVCLAALCLVSPAWGAFFSGSRSVEEIQKKLDAIPPERNYRTRSVLLSELGTQLYKEGRWDEAVQAFDSSLGYAPPNMLKKHIYLYMGKSYESSGRIDKAIAAYEQAVAFDKKNWRRQRDLARLYERVNLQGEAVAAYERALKYHPKEASVHFSLGRLYRALTYYEKAEKNLVAALDQGYKVSDVFSELSLVFEAQGKFADAASAAKEGLTDGSTLAEWARVVYLAILGRHDELIKEGMAALKKNNAGGETLRFYTALQRYAAGQTDVDNAQLAALFKETLP